MTIICVDPQSDPIWRRLVDRNSSTVFHSPEWIRILAETYAFECRAYVVLDGQGDPEAGIPFCRIVDIAGERIVILPFSDYCDPLVADRKQWTRLMELLLDQHCPVVVRCLHSDLALADDQFTVVKWAKWHGLDLDRSLDVIWNGLEGAARRAIRKAERDGVVVQVAQCEKEVQAFFEMHVKVRKYKYRLLAQPYRMFESIWHHFIKKGRGALMLASYKGEIIGGVLFLEWKDTLYYKFNASAFDELSQRPNDVLIWEGIKYGKAKGYNYLDLGLSDWDQEGLIRYKRKYATEERTISFLRHAAQQLPTQQEKEVRSVLTRMTELFTDESVPDNVSERAGDILYRYFS